MIDIDSKEKKKVLDINADISVMFAESKTKKNIVKDGSAMLRRSTHIAAKNLKIKLVCKCVAASNNHLL